METNVKCFIDMIKPTEEMTEKEVRAFADAARAEIKRMIELDHAQFDEIAELRRNAKLPEIERLAKELRERTATDYRPCAVDVKVEGDSICVYGMDDNTCIHPVEKVVHFAEYHRMHVLCSLCDGAMRLRLFK